MYLCKQQVDSKKKKIYILTFLSFATISLLRKFRRDKKYVPGEGREYVEHNRITLEQDSIVSHCKITQECRIVQRIYRQIFNVYIY